MGWLWATPEPSKASNHDKTKASSAATPSPAKQSENDYGDPEIAKFLAQIQQEFGSGSSSRPAESSRPTSTDTPKKPSSSPSSSLWGSIWGSSSSGTASATPSDHHASSSSSSSSAPSPFSLSNDQPTSTRQTLRSTTNTTQADDNDDAARPRPLDPLSESLLPTTMSCRQAFDAAFYCQGVGSQFHSIYRAGTVRTCSEHWDDFWFCMRNRTASGPRKEEAVRDYYRRKEWNKYGPGRPSSADVWESRDEKVPYDSAFRETYENPTLGDEEWRVKEIEHRRAVQEALAKDAQQEQTR
ncbi:Early meiotic induction protein 1 [Apiospora kogelbergensis]|uniref:Early meiotic induction protein 1 n=1 Tax=Apiospora kogelbergensis TaxID=1337665 RepID=UPI00312EB855